MSRFKDKVIWITGGGSGIGLALALELASQGAKLVISGRRETKLNDAAAMIKAKGGQCHAMPCDVTQYDSLKRCVSDIVAQHGKLDIAIANAGFAVNGRIEKVSEEDWRRQMDVNVVGLAQTARAALPALYETSGQIVLIASVAAFLGAEYSGAYCASKAAVRSIGITLQLELKNTGVRCTTIHPGFVESEIAQVDNQGRHNPNAPDKRPAKLMWRADKAAKVMAKAIAKRKREYVFTWHGKVGVFLGSHFPRFTLWLMGFGKRKPRAISQN